MIRIMGAICVFLALAVIGCGGGSDTTSTISYRPFRLPERLLGEKDQRLGKTFYKPDKNGLVGPELPKPFIPDRPAPEFTVSIDLIDSFSPAVTDDGDRLTMQYVGYTYGSQKKFASSWEEGKPFTFTLGKGEAMPGLEGGLQRMEIGDRREIVVPPDLTSGGSRMKDYPKGEALVFMAEALAIKEKE